jgi:hypothetical protein
VEKDNRGKKNETRRQASQKPCSKAEGSDPNPGSRSNFMNRIISLTRKEELLLKKRRVSLAAPWNGCPKFSSPVVVAREYRSACRE